MDKQNLEKEEQSYMVHTTQFQGFLQSYILT